MAGPCATLSAHRRQVSAQARMTSSSPPNRSQDSAQRAQASAQMPQYAWCNPEPRSMKSRLVSQACAQSNNLPM
jgi:hypothetical protein